MLGVLLTMGFMGFLYYRVRNTGLKALNRERQSFAVRVSPQLPSQHNMLLQQHYLHKHRKAEKLDHAGFERYGFKHPKEGSWSGAS